MLRIKRNVQRNYNIEAVNCSFVANSEWSPGASIEATIMTIIAAIYRDRKYSSGWPTANTDFKQLDLTAIFMIRSRR